MKIVHLSDTHLGFRAYSRLTERGINQREVDVRVAFQRALRKAAELQPDLVLIAGDMFHTARPSNYSLIRAYRDLMQFQKIREGRPLAIVAGNHETPRTTGSGCVLSLFENIPGTRCVYNQIDAVTFEDIYVLCVPSRGVEELGTTLIEPRSEFRVNVLMLHGMLEGVASFTESEDAISKGQILRSDWDYIALGDYHIHQILADNACYSGSTEFTSTNIWEERETEKGIVEYDSDSRRIQFHPIQLARRVIDLKPIHAAELTLQEINDLIAQQAEEAGVDDAIVRQRVYDLRHEMRSGLDAAVLRDLRSRALHYQLTLQAYRARSAAMAGASSMPGEERLTLEEEWRQFAQGYDLPKEFDREKFIQQGLEYLKSS